MADQGITLDFTKAQPLTPAQPPVGSAQSQPQSAPQPTSGDMQTPQRFPNATGAAEGPDGQMYWHDIQNKQLGPLNQDELALVNQPQQSQKPTAPKPVGVTLDFSKAQPLQTSAPLPPEKPGLIHRLWDKVNTGLISPNAISKALTGMSVDDINAALKADPNIQGKTVHIPGFGDVDLTEFTRGVFHSTAGVASSFTSPLSLALFATGPLMKAGQSAQAVRAAKAAQTAESAVNAADAVYAARTTEILKATQQAADAQKAVEAAEAAEQVGTGSRAATIAAQETASQAAANAMKAQKALKLAEEAKALNAVEAAKANRAATQAIQMAKTAGVAGQLPEAVGTVARAIGRTAAAGFTATGAANALAPSQPGETLADEIERRAGGAGWALLGAEGLKGSPVDTNISELPGVVKGGAKDIGEGFKNWYDARSAQKADEKLSAAREQAHDDLMKAIPPTKAANYSYEDMEIGRNYLEHRHNNVEKITNTEQLYDALEAEREGIESKVSDLVRQRYGTEPLTTNPKIDVYNALADLESTKPGDRQKGMDEISKYNITDLNLQEADRLRKRLNDENRAIQKKNDWKVYEALSSDPEFAARYYLAESLRNGIYDRLEERGVKGAREMRQDESALIRLRNAADRQEHNGDKTVKGTGEVGPFRKGAAKLANAAGIVGGVGAGAATGIPFVSEIGGVVGGGLGKKVGEILAPPDATRNELIQRSLENKVATGAPRQLQGKGTAPSTLTTEPIEKQQILPENTRENSPLHSALSTHYDETVGDTPYQELEKRFLDDVKIKKQHKVPLDGSEKTILKGINEAKAKEILDARREIEKQAKEAEAKRAEAEKAAKEKPRAELSKEHESVGIHEDDVPRRAKTPDVDFSARDLQDSERTVTPDTIRKDYANGDKNVSIYKSYIPMEDLPSAKFVEEGEEGFDREDYRPRVGAPIKVEVKPDGSLGIIDGNHRAQVWGENDMEYAPAWVVDRRGPDIEKLSESEIEERKQENGSGRAELSAEDLPKLGVSALRAVADRVPDFLDNFTVEKAPIEKGYVGTVNYKGKPFAYLGVPSESFEKVFGKVSDFLGKEQTKQAEDTFNQLVRKPKASAEESKVVGSHIAEANQSRLEIPKERLPYGHTEDSFHNHEWGHAAVAAAEGLDATNIASHEHEGVRSRLNVAGGIGFKDVPYIEDPNVLEKYTPKEIWENTKKWLTIDMGGAAANELLDDMKFKDNRGLATDKKNARAMLEAHGLTGKEADTMMQLALKRAKNHLTRQGVLDSIRQNAKYREENLPKELHASSGRVQRFQDQIRGLIDDKSATAKANSPARSGAEARSSSGEVKENESATPRSHLAGSTEGTAEPSAARGVKLPEEAKTFIRQHVPEATGRLLEELPAMTSGEKLDLEAQAGHPMTDSEAYIFRINRLISDISEVKPDQGLLEQREEFRKGLEKPLTAKQKIEGAGLVYKGELTKGSGVHMFEHPSFPGKTAALKEGQLTPEGIHSKMGSTLNAFGNGGSDQIRSLLSSENPDEFSDKAQDFVSKDYLPEEDQGESKLYHITVAKDKVLQEGLKSRKETKNVALGGGFENKAPDKISVTFDEGHANTIAERMELAIKAAKEEITPQQALDSMVRSGGLNDTKPFEVAQALGAPEDVYDDWDKFNDWFGQHYKKEDAYSVVQDLDDAMTKIFSESESPVRVGFTASKNQMARLDPEQIHILEIEARKGSKAEHVPEEAELRFKPEDIRIKK